MNSEVSLKLQTIFYNICIEYMFRNLLISLIIVNQSQEFQGNSDKNTPVTHNFTLPIYARFVRIFPLTWHAYNCMRFELYGCKEGEPVFKTIQSRYHFLFGKLVYSSMMLQHNYFCSFCCRRVLFTKAEFIGGSRHSYFICDFVFKSCVLFFFL